MVTRTTPSTDVAPHPLSALGDAVAKITGDLNKSAGDIQAGMVQRILDAGTPEEVFADTTTLHAEDVLGVPHTITDVDFGKSTYEQGSPAYGIVTGKTRDGNTIVYTNGSATCVAQLFKAVQFGLPLTFELVLTQKDKPTAAGFYPLQYKQP